MYKFKEWDHKRTNWVKKYYTKPELTILQKIYVGESYNEWTRS